MGISAQMSPLAPARSLLSTSIALDWHRPLWGTSPISGKLLTQLKLALVACQPVCFPVLWMFIGCVSSYDAYLTLKFEDSIVAMELNPLGQFLLGLDDGDPSLFMAIKFVGTIVVLGVLSLLHRINTGYGTRMAAGLAAFQGALLGFLTL
jgi:hypothetical protein